MRAMIGVLFLGLAVAGCVGENGDDEGAGTGQSPAARGRPWVVVATLDTGVNMFHETWARPEMTAHPSTFLPGYPADAPAITFDRNGSFEERVEEARPQIANLTGGPYPAWVPGTNLIGLWAAAEDTNPLYDHGAVYEQGTSSTYHGAQASSQIAGIGYSLAPQVYVVIMDRTPDGSSRDVGDVNAEGLRWAADQPWIDIIHTNIQNPIPLAGIGGVEPPLFPGGHDAVEYALSKGKMVVSAGGNFYAETTETSPHAGPSGVLVAGANDNCGYTDFSNPDPHVVMDGSGTVSAAPHDEGDGSFGGTSSASPRITGYTARLLWEVRSAYGITAGMQEGALAVLPEGAEAPATGPLADGRLTAAELHEVIRKTADPNPHVSEFDGAGSLQCIPQPVDSPYAVYAKMGYGEVSEHTLDAALAVLFGEFAMPERPMEDVFYNASETLRQTFWESI